jgi:hypothetical protein
MNATLPSSPRKLSSTTPRNFSSNGVNDSGFSAGIFGAWSPAQVPHLSMATPLSSGGDWWCRCG